MRSGGVQRMEGGSLPHPLYLIRAAIVAVGSEPPIEIGTVKLGRDETVVKSGPPMSIDGRPVGSLVIAVSRIVEPFETDTETIDIPAQ